VAKTMKESKRKQTKNQTRKTNKLTNRRTNELYYVTYNDADVGVMVSASIKSF